MATKYVEIKELVIEELHYVLYKMQSFPSLQKQIQFILNALAQIFLKRCDISKQCTVV